MTDTTAVDDEHGWFKRGLEDRQQPNADTDTLD